MFLAMAPIVVNPTVNSTLSPSPQQARARVSPENRLKIVRYSCNNPNRSSETGYPSFEHLGLVTVVLPDFAYFVAVLPTQ